MTCEIQIPAAIVPESAAEVKIDFILIDLHGRQVVGVSSVTGGPVSDFNSVSVLPDPAPPVSVHLVPNDEIYINNGKATAYLIRISSADDSLEVGSMSPSRPTEQPYPSILRAGISYVRQISADTPVLTWAELIGQSDPVDPPNLAIWDTHPYNLLIHLPDDATDGQFARFNSATGKWEAITVSPGGGDVTGPPTSTPFNLPEFADVTGKVLQDSGVNIDSKANASDLDNHVGAASPHSGHLVSVSEGDNVSIDYSDSRNPVISAGGDMSGPAGAVSLNFPMFDGTTGKLLQDSGRDQNDFALSGAPNAAVAVHEAKVDPSAGHGIDGVNGLQSALDGKDPIGSADAVQSNLDDHTSDSVIHVTSQNKTDWSAKLDNVVEDSTPQLGGALETLEHDIKLTAADGTLEVLLGVNPSENAGFLAHVSPDGIYEPEYGGILLNNTTLDLHGNQVIVDSLKGDGDREVRVSSDGILYAVPLPDPGFTLDYTSSFEYDLASGTTIGPWVEVTGLLATLPEDILDGTRLEFTIRAFIENVANKIGAIDVALGLNGADPTLPPQSFTIGAESGVISIFAAGQTTNHGGFTSGDTLSVFARRGASQQSGRIWLRGNVSVHEYSLAKPT